jgi:enamine deaminase RidA (YjgF/YER057c/UK114 family)
MVRHYIVDRTGDEEIDALPIVERGWGSVYEQFMDFHGDGHRPPDTVVGVASLATKELLYECEVTALFHEKPEVKKDDD